MPQPSISGSHPIAFLDTRDFLDQDVAQSRVDRQVDTDVTLSAIPDGSGGAKWEARTKQGKSLPTFRLTITPNAAQPVAAAAHTPVVIDAMEGIYVCYEDEARQQSWCVKVK